LREKKVSKTIQEPFGSIKQPFKLSANPKKKGGCGETMQASAEACIGNNRGASPHDTPLPLIHSKPLPAICWITGLMKAGVIGKKIY
jgi:hypothetical protein